MDERLNAEENLRVIRQLMERATVYRAISAPTALVAGILSLLAAAAVYYNNEVQLVLGRAVRPREFAVLSSDSWLGLSPNRISYAGFERMDRSTDRRRSRHDHGSDVRCVSSDLRDHHLAARRRNGGSSTFSRMNDARVQQAGQSDSRK